MKKTLIFASLLAASLAVHAAGYQYRVSAKGVVASAGGAAPTSPTTPVPDVPNGPLSPSVMDFGDVLLGTAATKTIRFTNTSDKLITITSMGPVPTVMVRNKVNSAGVVRCETPPYKLSPNGSCEIEVSYTPKGTETVTGEIRIESDELPVQKIPVSAKAVAFPGADPTPVEIISFPTQPYTWDVDSGGSIFVLDAVGLTKYSADGRKLATVVPQMGTCPGGSWTAGRIAIDSRGDVHLGGNGIGCNNVNNKRSVKLVKYSSNLEYITEVFIRDNAVLVAMSANNSNYVTLRLEDRSAQSFNHIAGRIDRDYAQISGWQGGPYITNYNAAVTSFDDIIVGANGASTVYLKAQDTGPWVGFGSLVFPGSAYSLSASDGYVVSHKTGHVYSARNLWRDKPNVPTANQRRLMRHTNVPYGFIYTIQDGPYSMINGLRADGAGCLYMMLDKGTSVAIAKTTTCGF